MASMARAVRHRGAAILKFSAVRRHRAGLTVVRVAVKRRKSLVTDVLNVRLDCANRVRLDCTNKNFSGFVGAVDVLR